MSFGGVDDHLDPERVTRTFVRVRRGYDPPAVDAHLAVIRDGVEKLHRALEADHRADDESLDLVLEATRRSIDDVLADARQRSDAVLADAEATATATLAEAEATAAATLAEAETTASVRLVEAESEAHEVVAAARTRARRQDETARERYVELGRLLEVRQTELLALDQQIANRQQVLRRAAQELCSLADGMPSPQADPDRAVGALLDPAPTGEPTPNGDAANPDHHELRVPEGVELHFPEQVGSDA